MRIRVADAAVLRDLCDHLPLQGSVAVEASEDEAEASITAEDGRPQVALLDLVRFRGDTHPALDAWLHGAEFQFAEPNWGLTLNGRN